MVSYNPVTKKQKFDQFLCFFFKLINKVDHMHLAICMNFQDETHHRTINALNS